MGIAYKLKISSNELTSILHLEALLFYHSPLKFIFKIKSVRLPRKIKKYVWYKSPHVNKKSKEHFQMTKYQRLFCLTSKYFTKGFMGGSPLVRVLEKKSLEIFMRKTGNNVNVVLKKAKYKIFKVAYLKAF